MCASYVHDVGNRSTIDSDKNSMCASYVHDVGNRSTNDSDDNSMCSSYVHDVGLNVLSCRGCVDLTEGQYMHPSLPWLGLCYKTVRTPKLP